MQVFFWLFKKPLHQYSGALHLKNEPQSGDNLCRKIKEK
jgi:hypothetical protein